MEGLAIASKWISEARAMGCRSLNLTHLGLTSLPPELAEFTGLTSLDLGFNLLSSLPEGLGRLIDLEELRLDHNDLTALPEGIGQLSKLRTLIVDHNQLSELPEQIGRLSRLKILRVEDNRLTALPDSMRHLSDLTILFLGGNQFVAFPDLLRHLPHLDLLYLHGNEGLGIPSEILGAPWWRGGGPSPKAADILRWAFQTPPSSPSESAAPTADELESLARRLLLEDEPAYGRAHDLLEKALRSDPDRHARIRDEFGFLRSVTEGVTLSLVWRHHVWRVLGRLNQTEILCSSTDGGNVEESWRDLADPLPAQASTPTAYAPDRSPSRSETTAQIPAEEPNRPEPLATPQIATPTPQTAEEKGEHLEHAVIALLRDFFTVDQEQADVILTRLRQQKRGSQFGHDIEFELQSGLRENEDIRCHIECKNIQGQITPTHIAEKLIHYDAKESEIHHWILISPHASPSNDLNAILEAWRVRPRHDFTVQVWCRDTHVEEFFGLNPTVYEEFYPLGGSEHPRGWSNQKREEVARRWRRKLEPVPRLTPPWEDYCHNSLHLCVRGEQHAQMAALFDHHAEMFGLTEAGTPLSHGNLESDVREWLRSERPAVLLLLGEFGDGKTVFTYTLARKLLQEFVDQPATGWLPIRFALRDFYAARDSREFLRRRLDDFKAALHDWNLVRHHHRILIVLDGLDEMTRQLDSKTVTENIRALRSCLDEFHGCKLLVTSRTHFFENRRDKQRLLKWLDDPLVLQLAKLSPSAVLDHLHRMRPDRDHAATIETLRAMHDPIGLAGKPLFLEMLKQTIDELPRDLDVVTLYRAYIHRMLMLKIPQLERDTGYLQLPAELITNLEGILQDIALSLQESQRDYVSLASWEDSQRRQWAEMLWKTSDGGPVEAVTSPDADADAMARVGARSLLVRVNTLDMDEKWTVDFCHRSVREYFVAKRLHAAIQEDFGSAQRLLNTPLNPEIIDFLVTLLRANQGFDSQHRLTNLAHSAVPERTPGRLGGQALTILYRLAGTIPGREWRDLVLDFADVDGADFSHKNFARSSLRYANLDNVNLENADFTDADLTGVRLEETTPVESLAVTPEKQLVVGYADGSVREWDISHADRSIPRILFSGRDWRPGRLGVEPPREVWAQADHSLTMFDRTEGGVLTHVARFAMRHDLHDVCLRSDHFTALVEDGPTRRRPVRVDYRNPRESLCGPVSPALFCVDMHPLGFLIYGMERGLGVLYRNETTSWRWLAIDPRRVSCIDAFRVSAGAWLVGGGDERGAVRAWRLEHHEGVGELGQVRQVLEHTAHDGNVSALAFLTEERVVSGGHDRSVAVIRFDRTNGSNARVERRLQLTLRCRGMVIDGVRGPRESELLQRLIAKGSE
jgi:hypothetical protein